jgi:hypothetical protein
MGETCKLLCMVFPSSPHPRTHIPRGMIAPQRNITAVFGGWEWVVWDALGSAPEALGLWSALGRMP